MMEFGRRRSPRGAATMSGAVLLVATLVSPALAASYSVSAAAQKTRTPVPMKFAGDSDTGWAKLYPDYSVALSFSGFDTELGTLTAVNYTYSFSYDIEFQAKPARLTPDVSVGWLISDYPLPDFQTPITGELVSRGDQLNHSIVKGENVLFFTRYRGSSPVYTGDYAAPAFSLKPMSSPFDLTFVMGSWTEMSLFSPIKMNYVANSVVLTTHFNATVEYVYTPTAVPEPTSLALMLAGVSLIGVKRRYSARR